MSKGKDSTPPPVMQALTLAVSDAASLNVYFEAAVYGSQLAQQAEEINDLLKQIVVHTHELHLKKIQEIEAKVKTLSATLINMKQNNPLLSDEMMAAVNKLGLSIKQLVKLMEPG